MTYHGSPLDSIRNQIEKRLAQKRHHDERKARGYYKGNGRGHIRDPEAYEQAKVENQRLGIEVERKDPRTRSINFRPFGTNQYRKISLARVPSIEAPPVVNERANAEKRAIKRIEKAIELLAFSIDELARIPNPNSTFKNRVHTIGMIDVVRDLAHCVYPPLKTTAERPVPVPPVKLPPRTPCVSCSGHSSIAVRGEWYCEDCAPAP